MRACPAHSADLHAQHDGELSPRRERRLERHLAGCLGCRTELARLGAIAGVLREDAARGAAPDLWREIAPGLARIDREIAATPPAWWAPWVAAWRARGGSAPSATQIGVGAAAVAAAAFALVLWPAAPPDDVVRSLDTKGHAVLVLPSQDDATIIWVMDDTAAATQDTGAPATL